MVRFIQAAVGNVNKFSESFQESGRQLWINVIGKYGAVRYNTVKVHL